jgi:hypothetical protein
MSQLLGRVPVQLARVRASERQLGARARGHDRDFELDVERPRLVGAQVGQRRRILRSSVHSMRGERLERRDPRRDRGGERLTEERTERLRLPALDLPRAPVVDEQHAEDVLVARPRLGDPAPFGATSPEGGPPVTNPSSSSKSSWRSGPKLGHLRRRHGRALPARPPDRRAAHDDAARAAVVGDREVAPVGQQRLAAGPHDPPEVRRVLERGVEVDVVANRHRQHRLDRRQRDERARAPTSPAPGPRSVEQLDQARPRRAPDARPSSRKPFSAGARSARADSPGTASSPASASAARSSARSPIRTATAAPHPPGGRPRREGARSRTRSRRLPAPRSLLSARHRGSVATAAQADGPVTRRPAPAVARHPPGELPRAATPRGSPRGRGSTSTRSSGSSCSRQSGVSLSGRKVSHMTASSLSPWRRAPARPRPAAVRAAGPRDAG